MWSYLFGSQNKRDSLPSPISSKSSPQLQQQQQQQSSLHIKEAQYYTNKALEMIKNQFQKEQDLNLLPLFINNYSKQITTIQSQIQNIVHGQLKESQVALQLLQCQYNIKEEYLSIVNRCEETKNCIDQFDLIHHVTKTLSNVTQVRDMLSTLIKFKEEVKELTIILQQELAWFHTLKEQTEEEEDESEDNFFDNFDNVLYSNQLLQVHERICQLEMFKSIIQDTTNTSSDSQILIKYCSLIDNLSQLFCKIIQSTFDNILFIAQEYPSKLVQIVRIVQREETKELQFPQLHKHSYKSKCYDYLVSFLKIFILQNNTPLLTIKEMIVNELDLMEQYVVPCFPSHYKIMEFTIQTLENVAQETIQTQLSQTNTVTNTDLLQMAIWIKEYKQSMQENYGMVFCDFVNELEMIKNEFIGRCSEKIIEWCNNIVEQDFRRDVDLKKIITISSENYMYTHAPVDLFNFIDQYMHSVFETELEELVFKVALTIRSSLMYFKDMIKHQLQLQSQMDMLLLIAQLNNTSKYKQFLYEHFESVLATMLSSEYLHQIEMDEIESGFDEIPKEFLDQLSSIVMRDVEMALKQSNSNGVELIVGTFADYWSDIERRLENQYHFKVMDALAKKTSKLYLESVCVNVNQISQEMVHKWDQDVQVFETFFVHHEMYFRLPIHALTQIVNMRDVEDVTIVLSEVLDTFGDMPCILLEEVIKKCTFVTSKTDLIKACKLFYENNNKLKQQSTSPSIFASLYNQPMTTSNTIASMTQEEKKKKKKKKKQKQEEEELEDNTMIIPTITTQQNTTVAATTTTTDDQVLSLGDFIEELGDISFK